MFQMNKLKLFIFGFVCILTQSTDAQWAGSSSNAGTQKVTPQTTSTYESKGRFNIGLGMGGVAKAVCEVYSPITSQNISEITANPDPSGFNFFLSGLQKTSFDKLWVGFESGLAYSNKTIEYEYYSTWSGDFYSGSEEVDILHFGAAIPIRYMFVENKEVDLYAQAVLGYGLIADLGQEESLGIFYGGGAFGARWTILFAEVGFNTTGYLRLGLSIPTAK